MGGLNHRYRARFNRGQYHKQKKAAMKKPAVDLPAAANKCKRRTCDFLRLMKQLIDWLAEPDDRRPYLCDYQGGYMHVTKDCIRASTIWQRSKASLCSACGSMVSLILSQWRLVHT